MDSDAGFNSKHQNLGWKIYTLLLVRWQIVQPISDCRLRKHEPGFPGGAVVENLPANAGDTGSSPGLGRSHMPREQLGP